MQISSMYWLYMIIYEDEGNQPLLFLLWQEQLSDSLQYMKKVSLIAFQFQLHSET